MRGSMRATRFRFNVQAASQEASLRTGACFALEPESGPIPGEPG